MFNEKHCSESIAAAPCVPSGLVTFNNIIGTIDFFSALLINEKDYSWARTDRNLMNFRSSPFKEENWAALHKCLTGVIIGSFIL